MPRTPIIADTREGELNVDLLETATAEQFARAVGTGPAWEGFSVYLYERRVGGRRSYQLGLGRSHQEAMGRPLHMVKWRADRGEEAPFEGTIDNVLSAANL